MIPRNQELSIARRYKWFGGAFSRGACVPLRKERFTEISKNLVRSENNFIRLQNKYIGSSNMINNAVKNFDILEVSLSVLHNYFDNSIKLFSALYI